MRVSSDLSLQGNKIPNALVVLFGRNIIGAITSDASNVAVLILVVTAGTTDHTFLPSKEKE